MEPYMPFIWIGFAIVMAVCEAATTQLVSIWFVVGAVAAAISTIFTPSIFIQFVSFSRCFRSVAGGYPTACQAFPQGKQ